MLTTSNALNTLSLLGLDCNKSYFLFCGSFGDKWYICSMLNELVSKSINHMIIAGKSDIQLIRIFLGEHLTQVLNCEDNFVESLRNICRQDQSCYMPCQSQLASEGQIQCPPGIRSLHIVDYPYFIHLSARGCTRYIDMLRLICFLPIDSVNSQPLYLNKADFDEAERILSNTGHPIDRLIIYNIVNYSHAGLTIEQQNIMIKSISDFGYTPVINVSGLDAGTIGNLREAYDGIPLISISRHLVKSVFDLVPAVIGVIGGAISIADTFSSSSILTFATRSMGFAGYTSALKRNVNFLDFENIKAEPRPDKPRVVSCINLPNHESISPDAIKDYVLSFLRQVSEL